MKSISIVQIGFQRQFCDQIGNVDQAIGVGNLKNEYGHNLLENISSTHGPILKFLDEILHYILLPFLE